VTTERKIGKREANREEVRRRIEDALLDFMVADEADRISHEGVAEAVGISRRTVYRYYPDRDSLMKALWRRTTRAAGPGVGFPQDASEVLTRLDELYCGFDSNAAAMMVALSSPEGRAVRNSMKAERDAAWRKALAAETAKLSELDRKMVLGIIQLLSTGLAWRELRDQWDLDGKEIAAACRWAIATLLRDVEERGARPLAEDGPDLG
jgi:AcrR family transcriptional regulator